MLGDWEAWSLLGLILTRGSSVGGLTQASFLLASSSVLIESSINIFSAL